jgi:phosphopantothenoylcysteine decarboxylase / phosphopantothenate---cysteine ligase
VSDGALAGRRVVLGVSGGIAAYKAAMVARGLVMAGAVVDVVLTRGAREFLGAPTFEGITGRPVHTEVWEDIPGQTHVALARAADAVVVYPATAHVLAKAAHGLADDLLTTTLLAATCPVVLAPAMHTEMWQHPATRANVATLTGRGVRLVGPVDGPLMGGDSGPGRAAEPEDVLDAVARALSPHAGDLAGRTVVVTAGGTREPIDPVRYLGNRSSGRMGFAVAAAAAGRGADVTLIAAPTGLATPPGVTRVDVTTAREMHDAVLARADDADVIIKAAAVADFRPAEAATSKLKKTAGVPTVTLTPNPDILADLGARRRDGDHGPEVLVGFAAETDDVEAHGRDKLTRKGCDLLVVNDVTEEGAGFEHDTNRVLILAADGGRVDVPLTTKAAVAERLLDEVVARLKPPSGAVPPVG